MSENLTIREEIESIKAELSVIKEIAQALPKQSKRATKTDAEAAPKRRGRPPKNPDAPPKDSTEPPKRRGRPPKNPDAPKRRGRPKKSST